MLKLILGKVVMIIFVIFCYFKRLKDCYKLINIKLKLLILYWSCFLVLLWGLGEGDKLNVEVVCLIYFDFLKMKVLLNINVSMIRY